MLQLIIVRNNSVQKSYGSKKDILTQIRKKSLPRAQKIYSKHKQISRNNSRILKSRNNLSKNEKLANSKKIMQPIWRVQ